MRKRSCGSAAVSCSGDAQPPFQCEWALTVIEFSFQLLMLIFVLYIINVSMDVSPISTPLGAFKPCNQVTFQPSF